VVVMIVVHEYSYYIFPHHHYFYYIDGASHSDYQYPSDDVMTRTILS